MRYFVTGGAGFIGSNYVEHLLENVQGITGVTIFDKFTYAANPKNYEKYLSDPRLHVIKGDICDFSLLSQSMKNHDFVIHFAAESHVDRSIENASIFIKTNVLGTCNVLEASRKSYVKTVIHVSTDEVYGSLVDSSADETNSLMPNSPYAASKAASDLMARSYFITYGLDIRTTRSCNNYGKYQFPEKVIPVFILKALSGEKLPIYGNGENEREWINVSDHVKGIQSVLEKGSPGEIYNIGSGTHLKNNELASKILKFTNSDENLKVYISDRKGHDFRYSMNSTKVQTLGFEPNKAMDLGLKETINWYKTNLTYWNLQ